MGRRCSGAWLQKRRRYGPPAEAAMPTSFDRPPPAATGVVLLMLLLLSGFCIVRQKIPGEAGAPDSSGPPCLPGLLHVLSWHEGRLVKGSKGVPCVTACGSAALTPPAPAAGWWIWFFWVNPMRCGCWTMRVHAGGQAGWPRLHALPAAARRLHRQLTPAVPVPCACLQLGLPLCGHQRVPAAALGLCSFRPVTRHRRRGVRAVR